MSHAREGTAHFSESQSGVASIRWKPQLLPSVFPHGHLVYLTSETQAGLPGLCTKTTGDLAFRKVTP